MKNVPRKRNINSSEYDPNIQIKSNFRSMFSESAIQDYDSHEKKECINCMPWILFLTILIIVSIIGVKYVYSTNKGFSNYTLYQNNDIQSFDVLDNILFLVFRSSVQDKNTDGIIPILDTWGNKDNNQGRELNIFFVNTKSQKYTTKDDRVIQPPFDEESGDSLLYSIHKKAHGFKWVFKLDDVTYVNIKNLVVYINRIENELKTYPHKPLWLGLPLKLDSGNLFTSGGAGYLLSKDIIDIILNELNNGTLNYNSCTKSRVAWEDLCISKLMKRYNIKPSDTRDIDGNDRFNVFDPMTHFGFGGIYRLEKVDWYNKYHWYSQTKEGIQCMSKQYITWHYVKPRWMYIYNDIFNHHSLSKHKELQRLKEPQMELISQYVTIIDKNYELSNITLNKEFDSSDMI